VGAAGSDVCALITRKINYLLNGLFFLFHYQGSRCLGYKQETDKSDHNSKCPKHGGSLTVEYQRRNKRAPHRADSTKAASAIMFLCDSPQFLFEKADNNKI